MKIITEEQMREVVKRKIRGKKQIASANSFGVCQSFLSEILNGTRNVGDRIARQLGFEYVSGYRKVSRSELEGRENRKVNA